MQDVALAETDAKLTTRYVRIVFRLVVEMSFVVKLQNNNYETTLYFTVQLKSNISYWYKQIFSAYLTVCSRFCLEVCHWQFLDRER